MKCSTPVVLPRLIPAMSNGEACGCAQSPAVRGAAEAAATTVISSLSPYAVDVVLPTLMAAMDLKKLWQTKVAAMTALVALSKQAPDQVKLNLPTIVPVLSGCVCDAKKQVKVRSTASALHPPLQHKSSLLLARSAVSLGGF